MWIAYDDERFNEVDRDAPVAGEFALRLRNTAGEVRWFSVPEIRERGIAPKCVDCDEGRGTCPEGRCRDCDTAHIVIRSSCRECHAFIMREDVAGTRSEQHQEGCPLATVDDYYPPA